MKKTLKSMLAIGATIALLGAGCAGSTTVDAQSSPEAVVNAFMTAVQKDDKASAKAVVDVEGDFGQNFDEAWEGMSELTVQSYTVGMVKGNEVNVQITVEEDGEVETDNETFEVRQDAEGRWWLVEP